MGLRLLTVLKRPDLVLDADDEVRTPDDDIDPTQVIRVVGGPADDELPANDDLVGDYATLNASYSGRLTRSRPPRRSATSVCSGDD